MRTLLILLLSVALAASAGCFGRDDGDDGTPTPTPTTPTGTTPTTTPTGTTPTTTTPTTPTTPETPAPRSICTITFDFSGNTPTPPETVKTTPADCGTVPAGYTSLTLNVTFATAQPVFVTNGVFVDLLDATGTAVATCAGPSGPGQAAAVPCTAEASATAGPYTLAYRGAGNIHVDGDVMAT